MSEKWRNENWFTSSWNFAEEVRSGLHFSDHIKIHDVTLRDGEQQAGLIFDYKQKIALAEKLSEMGKAYHTATRLTFESSQAAGSSTTSWRSTEISRLYTPLPTA